MIGLVELNEWGLFKMPDIKCDVHSCLRNIDGFCYSNDDVEIVRVNLYDEHPSCITAEYD